VNGDLNSLCCARAGDMPVMQSQCRTTTRTMDTDHEDGSDISNI
jgi:hypothetical protein